LSSCD